jgi:hypothetical protein
MPAGRYVILGDDGEPVGSEEFRCAPGPMGWRYFSNIKTVEPLPHDEIVDVVVDYRWRPVRVRIETGPHQLILEADGDHLRGFRDRTPVETPWSDAIHVDYLSPSFNAITCRRLTETTEIDVVFIQPYTLEPVSERQRYELLGDEPVLTPVGTFDATRWRYTALGSGWTADLWAAGDVIVKYDRLYDLEWYDPGASGASVVS